MNRVVTFFVITSLTILLGQALPSPAHHLVTETYNLEQIVAKADRIFVGTVIGVTEDYVYAAGGNLPVTVYAFTVDEVLKGSVGQTLSIKQIGHRSNPSSLFGHLPAYEDGMVVMLFLHADSQYGLTSPVGLGQGAFSVKTDGSIKVSVMNGSRNRGLLEGSVRIDALMQAESPTAPHPLKTAGDLPYTEFRNLVMKLRHR